MIALIVLSPVGAAQTVERGEGLAVLAVGLLHPGAGQRRGQIGDGPLARGREALFRLLVVRLLEGLDAEQELSDAMGGLRLNQILGQRHRPIPARRRGFQQERLLEDDLVGRIAGQRLRIELRRSERVMTAPGDAAGKIAAEKAAGFRSFAVRWDHLRIGRWGRENCYENNRSPRPVAQSRSTGSHHAVGSVIYRPKFC